MNYKEILEELKWNSCSYAEEDCYNCNVEDRQACSNMRILCKQAADAIERLTYERHLIQQSLERYDHNWIMDGDDVVLEIREILEGKQ